MVTMDINMPVMNGLGACKEIITEFPDAKIVVLTALGSKHHVILTFGFRALRTSIGTAYLGFIGS